MTRVAARARPLRGYLTDRLGRLNAALSDLAGRLRSVASSRVAENVADLIREAVEEVLAGTTVSYRPARPAHDDPTRCWKDYCDEPRYAPSTTAGLESPWPPRWADEEDARRSPLSPRGSLFGRDPQESDQHDESEADFEGEAEGEAGPTVTATKPVPSSSPRLQAALVLSLEASAWWLRRRRTSLLAALAVGGAAGTLTLFGSPLLDAGVATLRSLLALTG